MTVNTQKPIVIFRGDNTAAFDLRTIRILLTGDLDLTNATARFDLLDFTKSWTTEEVATGELSIVFDSAQTKSFALGPQVGTLRLYDMSTGTPRQLTIVNKIPFFVTNRVCEIDSQSYEADVCVSGGDVIHIEFKVGAGAVEGKADKVKNATAGDLASLTADGNLEDSGIPKTDVLRKSQMDSTPTLGSQNPVTSDGIKQAIDAATPEDYAQVKAQVEQNTGDIADIKEVIPNQASAQNQLADREFVNSSIQTNTATFRGTYNAYNDLSVSPPYPVNPQAEASIAAAIAAKLASIVPPVVPENNDYCFVQIPRDTEDPADFDPTVIERVDRYKCTVTESGGVTTRVWEYEWSLNNSSFTADQWAAINSGITSGLVEKLNGIEAGAQVNAIQTVKVNGTALTPDNKAVDVTVPQASTSAPVIAGAANAGSSNAYSRGDHVHPAETEVVAYRLPDDCFPITYEDATLPSGQQSCTIASNDGIRFEFRSTYNTVILHDIASEEAGGYDNGFSSFSASTLQWGSKEAPIDNLEFNSTAPTKNTWPVLEKDTVFVREVRVAKPSDIPVTSVNSKTGAVVLSASNVGAVPTTGGTMTGPLDLGVSSLEMNEVTVLGGTPNKTYYGGDSIVTNGPRPPIPFGPPMVTYNRYFPNMSGTFALLENITSAFSTSATYAVNKLCVHGKKLYRCTTAVTTAGAWTGSTNWTEATVQDILALLAPLASPAFTGTPTAPTPTAGDSSTKVATTAFVKTAVEGATPNLDYVMRVDPQTGNIYYTTPDANA